MGDVGGGHESGMREGGRVNTGLPIVGVDDREADGSERYGFNEQMIVPLVDRATAEGQAREEVVDGLLVTAEKETGKGFWMLLHLTNGRIHVLVGEDWKKRPKDLVLHDRIVPSHWIDDRGIERACLRVGGPAYDDFFLIDEARQAFGGLWADNAGIVVGTALRVGPVQLNHSFLALFN